MSGKEIPQPDGFKWEVAFINHHGFGEQAEVDGKHDSYETCDVLAFGNGFSVSLGCLTLTGDASDIEQAKRFAEMALRAIVNLSNAMDEYANEENGL